jgi:N-acetyl-anhydromuramyl-L-alanine amidase AmpD
MRILESRQHLVTHKDDARYHGVPRRIDDIWYLIAHATAGAHPFAISQEWQNSDLDPAGVKGPKGKTSYHFGIDRDGSITRALPITIVGYGCGDSGWPARRYPPGNGGSLNKRAISVAWANDDAGEQLTDDQIDSGLWLFLTLLEEINAGPGRVLGHFEVSPGRKIDPRAAVSMREFRQMLANTRVKS